MSSVAVLSCPSVGATTRLLLLPLPLAASPCAQLPEIPLHCPPRMRCQPKGTQRGREGAQVTLRSTQLVPLGLSLGSTLIPVEAALFLQNQMFSLSLGKAINFSHVIFASRRAASPYLCLWLRPALGKNIPLLDSLTKQLR